MNTDDALSRLVSFTSLRRVDIRWCPGLRDDHLRHLAAVPGLEQLRITIGMYLTDAGFSVLDDLRGIREITLIHCAGIGDETVEPLATASGVRGSSADQRTGGIAGDACSYQ
ncbi:MAG: hypothetical protein R3C10_04170 [Pirellulales bacterium]